MRIYYLDDEETLLDIVSEYLRSFGFEISTFSHVDDLMAAQQKAPAQLFILDYRLAEGNALEVAASLPDTPKILVTGELDMPKPEGFDALLNKPFPLKDLKELVSRHAP